MSYLDRKMAIEKLRGYKVNVTSILSEEDTIAAAIDDGIDTAISVLSTMPDADVEPVRHGKRVKRDVPLDACSKCGASITWEAWNYCPICGAKMEADK